MSITHGRNEEFAQVVLDEFLFKVEDAQEFLKLTLQNAPQLHSVSMDTDGSNATDGSMNHPYIHSNPISMTSTNAGAGTGDDVDRRTDEFRSANYNGQLQRHYNDHSSAVNDHVAVNGLQPSAPVHPKPSVTSSLKPVHGMTTSNGMTSDKMNANHNSYSHSHSNSNSNSNSYTNNMEMESLKKTIEEQSRIIVSQQSMIVSQQQMISSLMALKSIS